MRSWILLNLFTGGFCLQLGDPERAIEICWTVLQVYDDPKTRNIRQLLSYSLWDVAEYAEAEELAHKTLKEANENLVDYRPQKLWNVPTRH